MADWVKCKLKSLPWGGKHKNITAKQWRAIGSVLVSAEREPVAFDRLCGVKWVWRVEDGEVHRIRKILEQPTVDGRDYFVCSHLIVVRRK